MKKKGISLIVLIITIVVIIILATAIIVNIAQSDIIGNANTAVLSNDFQTFNEQLRLYKSEQLVETKGKFKSGLLNANYDNILIDEEEYKEGNIYDILTSLKGSRYDKKIYIQDGKIVADSEAFSSKEIKLLKEIGIEAIDASLNLEIVTNSEYTSITAKIVVSMGDVEKYYFKLDENEEYIESENNEYTFEDLNMNTEYTVYIKVLKSNGEESIEYTEIVKTKGITGEVIITRNPNLANDEYINGDVKVTLSYGEEIVEGYELQYKTSETDWTTYTGEITITKNTTVVARLYNAQIDEETAHNSVSIACIDKIVPVIDSITESDITDSTFKVIIDATDTISGIESYTLYVDGKEYDTIESDKKNVTMLVSDRAGNTTYKYYVVVKDNAGNKTTSSEISITTPADKTPPTIELVNLEYVGDEYAKVTLRAKDEKSEVKNILKDGNVIFDESLEKLEDNLYVYNVINNGIVTFSASDTLDNINTTGVSVNVSGLKYDYLVKYTDKINAECLTVKKTSSGYANVAYIYNADNLQIYRSAGGTNHIIFTKQLDMKQGDVIEMDYSIFHDGAAGGSLSCAFIKSIDEYNKATYTKIDTATTTSGGAVRKKENVRFEGEDGKYYLALAIAHPGAVNTTSIRIYDLKIYNDVIAPTVELVNVEYVDKEYAKITLRVKDNYTEIPTVYKDGVALDDTNLEKLEDDLYVYKARLNKDFKFTVKDNAGNVNEEGVSVTISGLEYMSLVSYSDTLEILDFKTDPATYYDANYSTANHFRFYRSRSGNTYLIFNEPIEMKSSSKLIIDYDIYDDYGGSNGTFNYAFVENTSSYASATYTKIATSTSKTATRATTTIDYTGEEGTYYLVFKISHPLSVYTTYVRLYDVRLRF